MLPLSRYFAFRQRCPILEPHQAFAPDHPHVPDSSPMSSGMFFPAILRENSAKSRQHQCRSFPAGRYRLVSSARFRPPPPGAPAIAQRCPAGAILRYPGRKRVPCPFLGDVGGFHALSGVRGALSTPRLPRFPGALGTDALCGGECPPLGAAGGLTDGKSTSSRGMWPDSHKRLGKYPRGHRIAQCDAGAGFPGSST
jgi:hypothetical protein